MKSNHAILSSADRGVRDSRESAAAADSTVPAGTFHLNPKKVIRLEKHLKVKTVTVHRGVVWLTSTPAKGDVLLRPGDRFELQDNWPYVIQALESAELALVRSGEHGKHLTFEFAKRPAGGAGPALVLQG